jgi:hypothetical protein
MMKLTATMSLLASAEAGTFTLAYMLPSQG